jgi:tetratricopeptide (TPR) repeat protein
VRKKFFYFNVVLCFCLNLFSQDADSLKRVLNNMPEAVHGKPDTVRCRVLSLLSTLLPDGEWEVYNSQLRDVAEKQLKNLSLNSALSKLYKKYLAESLNGSGFSFQYKEGNMDFALRDYRQSLAIREEIKDEAGMAECYNNMGGIYQNQGNISKSIEYYHKSLKLNSQLGDDFGMANALNNIARIYTDQHDTTKALEYYRKSFEKYKKVDYKEGLAISYNNVGSIYYNEGDTLRALEFFNKSLKIHEESVDIRGMSLPLCNIGLIYMNRGDHRKALDYFSKSLKLSEEIGYKKGMAFALYNLGNCYLQQKEYSQAIIFSNRALELAQKLGYPQDIFFASKVLKAAYERTNNYPKALEMSELQAVMQDSINNAAFRKETIKKQFQYEFEEKENALKLKQEAEEKINKALFAQKQKFTIIIFAFTLIAVTAFFVIIYYRNQIRKRKKEQEYELQMKDSEIKALQAQMNPHFIFNALGSVLEFIRRSDKEEAMKYLTKFSRLIRMVLESSNKKIFPLSEEIQILKLYLDLENLRFGNKFKHTLAVESEIEMENTMVPPLITQPFVENAILHGLQNKQAISLEKGESYEPELNICFKRSGSFITCTIADNGIGREKAAKIKNKKIFGHQSMGMRVTKNRLELLSENKCEIRFFDLVGPDGEPMGTNVEVVIPINEIY